MKLQEQNVFDKRFARRVSMMIESRLIGYKNYCRWANQIAITTDKPPPWVAEIATIKYPPKAVQAINSFIYAKPIEPFDTEQRTDEHVACLLLRYKRGEIAWATFLYEAGQFTDADNGHRYCEDFYRQFNALEDHEYAKDVEQSQRTEIEREYGTAIAAIEPLYAGFLEYFRLYVADEVRQKSPTPDNR